MRRCLWAGAAGASGGGGRGPVHHGTTPQRPAATPITATLVVTPPLRRPPSPRRRASPKRAARPHRQRPSWWRCAPKRRAALRPGAGGASAVWGVVGGAVATGAPRPWHERSCPSCHGWCRHCSTPPAHPQPLTHNPYLPHPPCRPAPCGRPAWSRMPMATPARTLRPRCRLSTPASPPALSPSWGASRLRWRDASWPAGSWESWRF